MIEFGIILIFSSFAAGIFTFFAPCTLPLVPAFLGVISGVGQDEIKDPERVRRLRGKIFVNALFYVLGFSLIFILFGVAFSLLGRILLIRIWLQRIGGLLVILFGLFLIGAFNIKWLSAEHQIRVPRLFRSAGKANSFSIGALFALGWSPCVGPLLGSILLLASGSGTISQGVFLLIVFSAGLAVPFLITAALIGKAFSAFGRMGKTLKVVNAVAGVFLIVLGALLVTNEYASVLNLLRGYFYRFQFYENFINRFL